MALNIYEESDILNEYLLFHYGSAEEILPYDFGPNDALFFPVRTVEECVQKDSISPNSRALDLGCAVGRSSFQLTKHAKEVIGIDFSHNFINAANELKKTGRLSYRRKLIGERYADALAIVPSEIDRARVHFQQGDAQALEAGLGLFGIVHAANLLCRLAEPAKLLSRFADLVAPRGQLILTTPHTWLETFTPKDNWLAGREENSGQQDDLLAGLRSYLDKDFELLQSKDMPFLIREHARKFQWSVAQATVWRRKENGS